jgi:putative restriction endonuclease
MNDRGSSIGKATPATSRQSVLDLFSKVRCFEARGERAPNKPLLLIYALGRLQADGVDRLSYAETHDPLAHLLRQFGSPRQTVHPEQPFGRLAADGLWQLELADHPSLWTSKGDLKIGLARTIGIKGGFPPAIAEQLRQDQSLLREVAHAVLDQAFPPSLHNAITATVGLDLEGPAAVRRRDPRFAYDVLVAYRRRCAFCGLGLRLGDALVAIDAAHIRWHAASGPSTLDNGLALCALHHRLFDQGALTLDNDYRIRLADELSGEGLADLGRLEGKPSAVPENAEARPAAAHLLWHHRQVFKGAQGFVDAEGRQGRHSRAD